MPTPVPPRVTDSVPVQPSVKLVAASNAVADEPPSVSVTFVSFTLVSACPAATTAAVVNVARVVPVTDLVAYGEPGRSNTNKSLVSTEAANGSSDICTKGMQLFLFCI